MILEDELVERLGSILVGLLVVFFNFPMETRSALYSSLSMILRKLLVVFRLVGNKFLRANTS